MRPVPGWTLITAGTAPILLVGGWTVAALLLGSGYDPATDTISVLASVGEPYRWLMTAAIAGLGVCHVATAVGLRAAPLVGRIALAGAGASAIVLALTPEPHDGASFQHGTVVAVGFSLMALWPALAARRGPAAPWVLRPRTVLLVTLLVLAGAAWFLVELRDHGLVGVAERALCAIQSLWPLVVVASCRRRLAAGLGEWRGVLGERVGHASAPPDEGRIRT